MDTTDDIRPFRIAIPQSDLEDLQERLRRTRWPSELEGVSWERGVPVAYVKDIVDYWQHDYDWRTAEARLNVHPQFTTTIDGTTIHFLHVQSPEPQARALMLLHGWPGSIVEFEAMIGPLTDPISHGGNSADAFHLVIPSLPGFGLSGPVRDAGWTTDRMAAAFVTLMSRLGYDRYGVQGGDLGAFIAPAMGRIAPDHVMGIHVNALVTFPSGDESDLAGLTASERERLERLNHFNDEMMGYAHIQGTRPQTLAYALVDSPVGQLAWIVEKFKEWTDPDAEMPEDAVDREHLVTNVMLYWLTGTAGSAANAYYESAHDPNTSQPKPRSAVPTGVAVSLSQDIAIRRFAERDHTIVHWSEFEGGGHFAAMEAPEFLTNDVRAFFRTPVTVTGPAPDSFATDADENPN